MCTAVSFTGKHHLFGRNFDYWDSIGEAVCITPRNYSLSFRNAGEKRSHYAMIGMVKPNGDFPLYFEATNEAGLSAAGLNFPRCAKYFPPDKGKVNVAPFEFIPWVLSDCSTVDEVCSLLERANVAAINYSEELPATPLHWFICDKKRSVAVESTEKGLEIHEDVFNVLTNSPPFDFHKFNMANYLGLSAEETPCTLPWKDSIPTNSFGSGTFGLPGDLTSPSRFVRASYTLSTAHRFETEEENVLQFFQVLSQVSQTKGCVVADGGKFEYTKYACCCSDEGKYYYKTYLGDGITCIDMRSINLDDSCLFVINLNRDRNFRLSN